MSSLSLLYPGRAITPYERAGSRLSLGCTTLVFAFLCLAATPGNFRPGDAPAPASSIHMRLAQKSPAQPSPPAAEPVERSVAAQPKPPEPVRREPAPVRAPAVAPPARAIPRPQEPSPPREAAAEASVSAVAEHSDAQEDAGAGQAAGEAVLTVAGTGGTGFSGGSGTAGQGHGPGLRRPDLIEALIAQVEKEKFYPPIARRAGYQGTVMVTVLLDATGRIVSVSVAGTDAHRLLVNAALKTLERIAAGGLGRFDAGEPVEITFPIAYELR